MSRVIIPKPLLPLPLSFSSENPDPKIPPLVVGGAVFIGKAVAGGVIGAAASWGTNRVLDNAFPARK